MGDISYENFDLMIERTGDAYRARVQVADHECKRDLALREDAPVLSRLIEPFLEGGRHRDSAAPAGPGGPPAAAPSLERLGTELYSWVFDEEVRDALKTALDRTRAPATGLRIRLHLDAPELVGVAWELLFDPTARRFPALSEKTPIVRYLDLAEPREPLPVTAPLNVLVAISSPRGVPELDVEREWEDLRAALRAVIEAGRVHLERLDPPTLQELRSRLLQNQYHVFHFIGHGGFDEHGEEGFLLFQNPDGGRADVSGEDLGTWFGDHFSLRLAILNSCEGGVTSSKDPFAGVAQKLVEQGTPAVVAMQCAITDQAAITFSEGFYQAVATGRPMEAAVATGRKAIRTEVSDVEWATPVLYSRLPHGVLFEIDDLTPEQRGLLNDQAVLKDFWNPTLASTATLFFSEFGAEPSEVGEIEPVVGLPYAMMLGEIRQFLARMYEQVVLTDDRDRVAPDAALFCLGGPVTNALTAEIVSDTPLPVWFLGMPYAAGRERSLGTELDVFRPQLSDGALTSDVGVVARIVLPDQAPRFVIAGCYGAGTLGVARLLMSPAGVSALGSVRDVARLEVVVRSYVTGWDVTRSEVLTTRPW